MQQSIILFGLFFCHWLGDFTGLSMQFMLKAKKIGKPLLPILMHAGVHAFLMGMFLLLYFTNCFFKEITDISLWLNLILFQLITHFLIDVWKGKMNVWFPVFQNPDKKQYWTLFGFDQLLHAIVIITMSSLSIKMVK